MDVSIIIPARDESGNLPGLLDEIDAAMKPLGLQHEILVVDDGSEDDTWSVLSERAAVDSSLHPIRHRKSAGQSTSLWQAAQLAKGRWLATLDGDGQNDPADLPRLLQHATEGKLEMVAGHRTTRRDTWFKRLSSKIANGVRSRLLRDNTPDTGCGLKVIRRDAFLRLPYFDHMHRYLPALIQFQGGRCESVPVNHRPRGAGESHYGLNNRLWAGLLDLMGVMWLRKRCRLPAECETMDGTADKEEQS
ncbi:glycosyltransferase family 2 protein [Wenzhouxiangella sediminis]|uniref:Glycosyltransferase family 2 protein n=1 Tax=Wenzhouxiangella sediminis TaxID=1792836 RepID=A0A3E1K649_9GAMM|nr:glycosyltransferase family 2 protein [Wenzhouxiangella sediminis]RFF29507.1 glycosyltransferase family 2 protein [Wenzhouxiangella sediminis]